MKVGLKVIAGPHAGQQFEFDAHDTFIVGRAAHAHFRLPQKDKYFSRSHFLIEVNPPLCRLMDLGSTNGTYVNGERVTEIDLQHKDVIVGGKTKIRVAIESAGESRATRRQVGAVPPHRQEPQRAAGIPTGPTRALSPPAEQPSGSPIIDQVGPYRLIQEIGRGGMGIVYLAERPADGSQVAVKMIRPDADIQPRDLELFMREARVLQSLRHPHIVQFLDLGESDGQLFLAMEFVHGINAADDVRASGPMKIERAVTIICQILEALEYAHGQGYIHRDIKPENILLQRPGGRKRGQTPLLSNASTDDIGNNGPDPFSSHAEVAKVADFGLARVYQTSRMSGLTLRGEMGGSLAFAPPEQLTNYREAKPAGDLYSAAATLYTLLTGQYVYDFPDKISHAVLMILQNEPLPISSRRADVPKPLAAVIHRALARDPAERPPSTADFRRSLLQFT